jgi:PAS domain-containing protein
VAVRDIENRFIFANEKVADLVGMSVDKIVGKTPAEIFDFSSSEWKLFEEKIQKVVKTRRSILGIEQRSFSDEQIFFSTRSCTHKRDSQKTFDVIQVSKQCELSHGRTI